MGWFKYKVVRVPRPQLERARNLVRRMVSQYEAGQRIGYTKEEVEQLDRLLNPEVYTEDREDASQHS